MRPKWTIVKYDTENGWIYTLLMWMLKCTGVIVNNIYITWNSKSGIILEVDVYTTG